MSLISRSDDESRLAQIRRASKLISGLVNRAKFEFGTTAEELIRKLEEAGLEKPSLEEASLALYFLSTPIKLVSSISPLLAQVIGRTGIAITWLPKDVNLTASAEPEVGVSGIILNLPTMLARVGAIWAVYGKYLGEPREVVSTYARSFNRMSTFGTEILRPIIELSRTSLPLTLTGEEVRKWYPTHIAETPFVSEMLEGLKRFYEGSTFEILVPLLGLTEVGIGLPMSFQFMHELFHILYAHPTRDRLLMRELERRYPIARNEQIMKMISHIMNQVEDALINTQLLYYMPLLYGLGGYMSELEGPVKGLLLSQYSTIPGIGDLVHMLESAEKLEQLNREIERMGMSKIPIKSEVAERGLKLIGEIVSPVEGGIRRTWEILEKYGLMRMFNPEISYFASSRGNLGETLQKIGQLSEKLEEVLRGEVYSRLGYERAPPIEVIHRRIIEPILKFLSKLEQVPTQQLRHMMKMIGIGGSAPHQEEAETTGGEGGREREEKKQGTERSRGEKKLKKIPIVRPFGKEEKKSENPLEEIRKSLETLKQVVGLLKSAGVEPLGMKREIEHLEAIQELRRLLQNIFSTYGEQLSEESTWLETPPVERILRRMGYKVKIPGDITESRPVYFLIDTSGSISEEELGKFLGTVLYLTKHFNVNPIVIFWDAEAYGPYTARSAVEVYKNIIKNVSGGGGTVIKPALELLLKEIKKSGTVAPLIVMTDTEIFDIKSSDTLQLLRKVARMTSPKIWMTTSAYPPETIIKLGFKPVRVIITG